MSVRVSCQFSLFQAQNCSGEGGGCSEPESVHFFGSFTVRVAVVEWRGLGQGSPVCALGILREIPLLKQCQAASRGGAGGLRAANGCTCLCECLCPLLHAHTLTCSSTILLAHVDVYLLRSVLSHALCPFAFLSSLLLL